MAVDHNPLHRVGVLFDMYMHAVSEVLDTAEIRGALEDLNLSPSTLRLMLVSDARRVVGLAPAELAAYEDKWSMVAPEQGDSDFEGVTWAVWLLAAMAVALLLCGALAAWVWDGSSSAYWLCGKGHGPSVPPY
jgi:hypothetical protein